jgi:hypothetical protein
LLKALLLGTFGLLTIQQSTTGRVEIMVRDANTREGVPGVPVTLTFKFPNEPAGPSTTLVTDPRGLAVFSALGEGMYRIQLGEEFRPLPFTDYVLLDPGDQKRLDLEVNRIANVSVRVLDQNGQPLKNALVTLPSLNHVNGRRTLKEVQGIVHNDDGDGMYRLTGVPSGEYYVRIEQEEPPAGSREGPPRIAYYPGVQDFADAARVVVRGGDLLLSEVRLPLQPVFKISGTVVNPYPDKPMPITWFAITPADSIEPATDPRMRYTAASDPREVSFEFNGLSAGTYVLYPATVLSEFGKFTNRTVVTVEDRDIEDLRIVLKPRASVKARVTTHGESANNASTLKFGLIPMDPLPAILYDVQSVVSYEPDPQTGELQLWGLVEGVRYAFSVSGLPEDVYIADIRTANLSILSDGSFVVQSSEEAIEIHLEEQGGVVQGVARDAAGQPVANASVLLAPDFAKRKNSLLYKRTITNSAGQFSVRGLAPGDYQLFAWSSPPPGAEEDPAFLEPFESRSTTVRANAGLTTEADPRVIQ